MSVYHFFVFELGPVRDRRTDRRARALMRPIRTAA